MSTVTRSSSPRAPLATAAGRTRLVAAAPSLWRVIEPGGRVIGHLQEIPQAGGTRFRARRFSTAAHAFRDLGDFWSADDAVECLVFAR